MDKKTIIKTFFFFLALFFSSLTLAGNTDARPEDASKDNPEPPKKANFMLRSSQQPGAFISFGQNIIDKNQWQYFISALDYHGPEMRNETVTPAILYGISEKLSIFFSLPIVVENRMFEHHSSGLGDSGIQLEYAFYSKSTACFIDQATIVTGVNFPSGSARKNPNTGLGAPSFFLGGTYSHAYPEWFIFTSEGVLLPGAHNGRQSGKQYLYQGGVGRNLFNIKDQWVVALIAEANGQHTEKTLIQGTKDPNSGGNTIYITPSIWISSKNLVVQLGVGFPIQENLFGDQAESRYLLAANVGWTFD